MNQCDKELVAEALTVVWDFDGDVAEFWYEQELDYGKISEHDKFEIMLIADQIMKDME